MSPTSSRAQVSLRRRSLSRQTAPHSTSQHSETLTASPPLAVSFLLGAHVPACFPHGGDDLVEGHAVLAVSLERHFGCKDCFPLLRPNPRQPWTRQNPLRPGSPFPRRRSKLVPHRGLRQHPRPEGTPTTMSSRSCPPAACIPRTKFGTVIQHSAGMMPAAPLVGAVTTLPPGSFFHLTARAIS